MMDTEFYKILTGLILFYICWIVIAILYYYREKIKNLKNLKNLKCFYYIWRWNCCNIDGCQCKGLEKCNIYKYYKQRKNLKI